MAKSEQVPAGPAMPSQQAQRANRRPGVGAALLDEVEGVVRTYAVLPSENAYVAVTLWVAATHAVPFSDLAPRLAVVSPTKRCGKSRLMDLVESMAYAPIVSANASVAAIVRSINPEDPPTILLDEADTVFGTKKASEGNEDLRGLINAGHQRGRPTIRWDPIGRRREELETFSMAMLASIRDLPDTIMDRAVVIRMRRRTAGETVGRFRTSRQGRDIAAKFRPTLTNWVRSHADELETELPEDALPVEDRAADTWELLIRIADLAGGDWPKRVRQAAVDMTRTEAENEGGDSQVSQELLLDIRTVTEDWDQLNIHSATLINKLVQLDDSRWSNFTYGRSLSATELNGLLKPFEVHSKDVKVLGSNRKGFAMSSLRDAFTRYLQQAGSPAVAPRRRRRATRKTTV